MCRDEVQRLAVPAKDISELGVADPHSILQHVANTGSRSPGELLIT